MFEYIYFLKATDSSRFKIGSTSVCLNRRYKELQVQYGNIFDVSESLFMIAPKEFDLKKLERFLHSHFGTYRIGRAKSEFFRIDVFEQCLFEVARLYKKQGRADDYSWTMHSLADYYECTRSDEAQKRIKRFIRCGHKHLKPGGKRITKAEFAHVCISSWYPPELERKLNAAAFETKRNKCELMCEAVEDLLQKYSAEIDRVERRSASDARRRKAAGRAAGQISTFS